MRHESETLSLRRSQSTICREAVVKTSDHPGLGTILTDASGRTVYLFTVDDENKSNCSGGCSLAWPPLLTDL